MHESEGETSPPLVLKSESPCNQYSDASLPALLGPTDVESPSQHTISQHKDP